MKNEKTSKAVSSIASRVLKALKDFNDNEHFAFSGEREFVQVATKRKLTYPEDVMFSVRELKTLAASALTQAPDKPKKKAAK